MGRKNRQISATDRYHIILRGVNKQDIFLDDSDKERFLETLKRYCSELDAKIIVYCLMNNHVHLLAYVPNSPDRLMKKVASSYVYYFNHKYDRTGHLFQERYKSEPVQSDSYLLTAARYILQNPMKAGICKTQNYSWSSWNSLKGGSDFCDPQILIDLAGGINPLIEYFLTENTDSCLEVETSHIIKEDEALRKIQKVTGLSNPLDISKLSKESRNDMLSRIKKEGIPVRQLSRLTGIDRNIIQRA